MEFIYSQIEIIEALLLGELEEDEEVLIRLKNDRIHTRKKLPK